MAQNRGVCELPHQENQELWELELEWRASGDDRDKIQTVLEANGKFLLMSLNSVGCGYQLPLKMFLVSWVYTGQIVLSGTKHN